MVSWVFVAAKRMASSLQPADGVTAVVATGFGTGSWVCLAAGEAHDAGSGSDQACPPSAAVAAGHSPVTIASAAAASRVSVSMLVVVEVGVHLSPPFLRCLSAAQASAQAPVLVVCADSTSEGAHLGFALEP